MQKILLHIKYYYIGCPATSTYSPGWIGVKENAPPSDVSVDPRRVLLLLSYKETDIPLGPDFLDVAAITFPVIPKPLKIKFISFPWLQRFVVESSTLREISNGSKLQPLGGSTFKTYSPLL